MPASRVGFRGYVSSREFGGLRVPVPIQALVLRDYCTRKQLIYKLHVSENMFPSSYMVLEGLMRSLDGFEGVLMFSMFMLPERSARRARIYRQVFDLGVELHLVSEEMVIKVQEDVEAVEEILSVYHTLQSCPKSLPAEFQR
ncbi:MAG TPA: LIC12192 family sporadic carbohydrate cluster protein [Alphaproteobacteria bacterium]|nr:LIC12192 family sporadic carbohydrate cluster protein [Alphaproteobacteria bacterium]